MKKQSNLKRVVVVWVLLFCAASAFMAGCVSIPEPGVYSSKDTSELDRLTDEGVKACNEANYSEALAKWEKGLEIAEKSAPNKVGVFLNNLGSVYQLLGDYARAKEMYERALAIDEKYFGKDQYPNVATCVGNLGSVYHSLGDYAHAKEMFERALAVDEKHFGKDHPNVAICVNNLAGVYSQLGDYVQAKAMFERALAIAEQSSQPELLWTVQYQMGYILAKQNHPNPAVFFGKKAVNTIQKMRAGIVSVEKELQKSFVADKAHAYKDLADLLINQGRIPEAQQVLAMLKQEEYFDFIRRDEKSDARSTEASYTAIEEPWVKRYQEIQTKLAGLGKEHGELRDKKKLGLTPEEDARFKQLQEDLKAANRKFQDFLAELVTELGKVGTERAAEIGEKNLDKLKALQGTLKELGQGSVVIHYLMTDEKLRMILTTPNIQLVRDSLISAKDLNQKIFAFRETLQNPRKNPLPQARDLYDAVFKPIAEDLKQAHAQTLMISLDSTMRYIPISALHDGAQYVAEQYRIVIFTEAAKTKLTGQPVSQLKLAGLGLTKQIAGFNPLPSVKDELEGIAKIIPGVIHLDETFTKDIFTDVLDTQYPVLHISSHFVFKPGTENDSFLLLGNGDKLSLADIRNDNFDFNSVDLLSLSACETAMGGGKDANGREIEGFGALAQNQGAKAVLATLWPVADKSTGIFMQKMHELRKDKKSSKAEALQSAQILFIRGSGQKPGSGGQEQAQRGKVIYSESADKDVFKPDPEKPYAHPFFWAPFILMGNWL